MNQQYFQQDLWWLHRHLAHNSQCKMLYHCLSLDIDKLRVFLLLVSYYFAFYSIPSCSWSMPVRFESCPNVFKLCITFCILKHVSKVMYCAYMWQCWVEIEDYSVEYFDRITAVAQNFRYGWGSYSLCRLIRYWCILATHMSPTLNGSFALQHLKHSNAVESRNGIMFDFPLGLSDIRNNL